MMRTFLVIVLGLVAGLSLLGLYAWRHDEAPAAVTYGSSVVEALSGTDASEGFAKALAPRPFVFPQDAGPHPDFQTEWWYYTGNLDADDGRHFGYQLTVFRRALTARPARRDVDWAASQVYFAHFALTDVAGAAFHDDERWSREALGLAGARAASRGGGAAFDAWVESWSMRADGDDVRLKAESDGVAVDLRLRPLRGASLQGDRGLSHKSVDPANASYYYSVSRLETTGTVTVNGRAVNVAGLSWLDREWSTSALSKDEVGWDWFSLQLSDGRDIMIYRMRRRDGGLDPNSSGSVMTDGRTRSLRLAEVEVEALSSWKSPSSGAVYPASWRVRIPSEGLDLRVEPWLPDQELRGSFRYWEGAVRVRSEDGRVRGNGYVELTGYADAPSGP